MRALIATALLLASCDNPTVVARPDHVAVKVVQAECSTPSLPHEIRSRSHSIASFSAGCFTFHAKDAGHADDIISVCGVDNLFVMDNRGVWLPAPSPSSKASP